MLFERLQSNVDSDVEYIIPNDEFISESHSRVYLNHIDNPVYVSNVALLNCINQNAGITVNAGFLAIYQERMVRF